LVHYKISRSQWNTNTAAGGGVGHKFVCPHPSVAALQQGKYAPKGTI